MDRKTFLQSATQLGLGLCGLQMLQACMAGKQIRSSETNNQMKVSLQELQDQNRKQLVLHPKSIGFPVLLVRKNENDYQAFLLRCTHQGAELSLSGNLVSCPAHGSEFDTNGQVLQGPAETALKTLPLRKEGEFILIDLS